MYRKPISKRREKPRRKENPWRTIAQTVENSAIATKKTHSGELSTMDVGTTVGKTALRMRMKANPPRIGKHWNRLPGSLDPRSHVRKNGDIWLYGADMEQLRRAVYERSAGRCEAEEHAKECTLRADWYSGEMHHKVIKGMGGRSRNDVLEGMLWLSKACHRSVHRA